jgi:hypothetical protein
MAFSSRQVPGAAQWAGYQDDLEAQYAHGLLFGKLIDEVQECFADDRSMERAAELHFMPRGAFQYYILAFAQFLQSERARGDSNAASSFLHLLIVREQDDPGSVSGVYPELASTVDFVGANQEYFDAAEFIYGSFRELAAQVRSACSQS